MIQQVLSKRGWSLQNHDALNAFLASIDSRSVSHAVFDWDDTCIFQDTQDFVFRRLVEEKRFRFDSACLRKDILPRSLWEQTGCDALPVSYDSFTGDWLRAPALDALVSVYQTLCASKGLAWAYRWSLLWLKDFTSEEIRALSRETVRAELEAPLRNVSPLERQDARAHPSGLRLHAEMQELVKALQSKGVVVWIVTASHTEVIEPLATEPEFGFGLPAGRVLGNAPLNGLEDSDPGTWGPGKVRAIRQHLKQDPLFIAGDSEGDYSMLTEFPGLKLGLILERETPNRLFGLHAQDPKRYLYQKRDFKTGAFKA